MSATRLDDFHAYKRDAVRRNQWRAETDHGEACLVCRRLVTDHLDGDAACWEGRARMALARLPEHRGDVDLAAVARFPQPRSGLIAEVA